MGAQPGDCTDDQSFSLPGHQELNLTDQQCAERIAEHFSSISKEYSPLIPNLLPDRVKTRLADGSIPPRISEYDCYLKLKAAKKTINPDFLQKPETYYGPDHCKTFWAPDFQFCCLIYVICFK